MIDEQKISVLTVSYSQWIKFVRKVYTSNDFILLRHEYLASKETNKKEHEFRLCFDE